MAIARNMGVEEGGPPELSTRQVTLKIISLGKSVVYFINFGKTEADVKNL